MPPTRGRRYAASHGSPKPTSARPGHSENDQLGAAAALLTRAAIQGS